MPEVILRCFELIELKDLGRPVAFIAKMVGHRPLAVHVVRKGLLDPSRIKRLLHCSSPREVKLDVLMIVSDLARMDKVIFYVLTSYYCQIYLVNMFLWYCQFYLSQYFNYLILNMCFVTLFSVAYLMRSSSNF